VWATRNGAWEGSINHFSFVGYSRVVLDACGVEGLVNHSVTVGRRDWGFVSGSRLMISLRAWSLSWGQMWKTRAQIGLVEWSSGDGVVEVVVAWYLVHIEQCAVRSDSRRNMCVQVWCIGNTGEILTEYRPKIPNWSTTLDLTVPAYWGWGNWS